MQAKAVATVSRSSYHSKQKRLLVQVSEVRMQCMYVGFLNSLTEHTEHVAEAHQNSRSTAATSCQGTEGLSPYTLLVPQHVLIIHPELDEGTCGLTPPSGFHFRNFDETELY